MKKKILNVLLIGVFSVFFIGGSYSLNKEGDDFITIPVDVSKTTTLSLSAIADDIKAIELETTKESLIGNIGLNRYRVLISDDYILFFLNDLSSGGSNPQLFLFNDKGKFLNKIGGKGQGPGEYPGVSDVAADFENKKIYISTYDYRLICYDFKGKFIKENRYFSMQYLNYTNNKLFAFASSNESGGVSDYKVKNMIYEINNDLKIIDSIKIRDVDLVKSGIFIYTNSDNLTCIGDNIYVNHSLNMPPISLKPVNTDTLYLYKNKTLIPVFNLKFSNEKTVEGKLVQYIYKSTRYALAQYSIKISDEYFFCYDMKEKKSYHIKDGYKDDIRTGAVVRIRPVSSNANMFYYLHTNISDTKKEEPNPTLYIGTLKK